MRRAAAAPVPETRLVLHIGLPKTGTSAIQHVLAAGASELAEVGLHVPYPHPDAVRGAVTAGNGAPLFGAVTAASTPAAMRDAAAVWLAGAVAPGQTSIVSSELLGTLSTARVTAVVEAATELAEVEVVAFVRDVYEHAYAAWGQLTKEGFTESFERYCAETYATDSEQTVAVLRWADAVPGMAVCHYDTHRHDVLETLFEAIGTKLPAPLRDRPVPQVNRSL
ncbi:MAG TPA: hypothetical protein VIY72_11475, partial [Acidimicrobiales bacterium]